jgi:stage II sporulation protein D
MRRLAALLLLPLAVHAQPVKVRIGANTVAMPIERYVAAVLAGESSVFRSAEARKAMAVAARTYAVRLRGRHSAEGFDFCSTTHCQRVDVAAVTPALKDAAAATAAELLWFEGKPAFTPYTRDCGGRTEEAGAVWPDLAAPYLTSRADPYCSRDESSGWHWRFATDETLAALRQAGLKAPPRLERIAIAKTTPSGRAALLSLIGAAESVPIDARSFRFAVGRALGWNLLPGDLYRIRATRTETVFEGRGAGHGVGLCQHGAEQMGLAGKSYREILAAYYPGARLGVTARGFSWQRLAGDSVVLATTEPERDRPVLAKAERELHAVQQRLMVHPSEPVELRVYPDIETFRNATGEPGWVAARSNPRRIEMQPAAVLESRGVLDSTLRHELMHAVLERLGAAAPVWFREGLAGYLEHSEPVDGLAPLRIPPEADLRQRADEQRARRAYADATRAVRILAARYGETSLFDWLKRGLPPEVKNATASQAATNSR